jgi:hypothetical protein
LSFSGFPDFKPPVRKLVLLRLRAVLLLGLLREDAAAGNRHVREQLVELLVVADRKLEVARRNRLLVVVARGVASELQNLSSQVLEDRSQVDRRAASDTLRIFALAQGAVDAVDRELQSCLARTGAQSALGDLFLATLAATYLVRGSEEGAACRAPVDNCGVLKHSTENSQKVKNME